jgi:hypothetical protein
MLEQARFSLARAGVMVGLCGAIVLGGGWLVNQRQAIQGPASVHFGAQTWQRVQSVLRHVIPAPITSPPQQQQVGSAGCDSFASGHAHLQKTVAVLQNHLVALHRAQFVQNTYQLDLASLLNDPEIQQLSCGDLTQAVRWLNDQAQRQGSAFWTSLAWQERWRASAQVKFEPNVWVSLPRQMLTSRSAWAGLPGCFYGTDANTGQRVVTEGEEGPVAKFCQSQSATDQALRAAATWSPRAPGWASLVEPLAPWRLPQHAHYSETVGDENWVTWGGQKQPVGLHAQLSIDPRWQSWLQDLAECFSGKDAPGCMRYATQAQGRYENARVRMAGISVIDVASGRVVAAASANSPCYAHDKTRIGELPRDCPALPLGTVYRPQTPQSLGHHAFLTQAPPGSLVKPLLMTGILQYAPAEAGLAGLEQALQRSDSSQFLDALLCRRQLGRGEFAARCERPALAQRSAHQLGWNSGCDGGRQVSPAQCGMIDVLYGIPLVTRANSVSTTPHGSLPTLAVLMGQTLVAPAQSLAGLAGYQDMPWPDSLPSREQRKACAQSGPKGYVRCGGAKLAVVSEAYGQGNTLSTPTGVAGMLATLANSAQGQKSRYPHLLVEWIRSDGRADSDANALLGSASDPGAQGVDSVTARKVIAAMETTILPGGTAHAACVRTFGLEACQTRQGVAGKTGTPGDVDERSLAQLTNDMHQRAQCAGRTREACASQYPLPRPRYRWYAALFKSRGSDRYDKAVAVLVHSNWRRADGRYADDQNAAAEMGMLAIRQFQAPVTRP